MSNHFLFTSPDVDLNKVFQKLSHSPEKIPSLFIWKTHNFHAWFWAPGEETCVKVILVLPQYINPRIFVKFIYGSKFACPLALSYNNSKSLYFVSLERKISRSTLNVFSFLKFIYVILFWKNFIWKSVDFVCIF